MNWPTTNEEIIRQVVLPNEGGYVNNSADIGGPTQMGITQATLAAWRGHPVTADDVRFMPQSEAIAIYEKKYIADPNFDLIPDMMVRTAMVDGGVLFGTSGITKALQTILGVPADGVMGNATAAAMDHQEPRGLVNALSVWRIKKHAARCASDHSQTQFLQGWVARATAFIV